MNDRPFPERPMGERMTEGQIEDVLSAIRRLVSDEALSAVRAVARQAPPPKLILTAAQRVHLPADLPRAVEVIGAAVPAQGFESDTGDVAPAAADWPAALWDAPAEVPAATAAAVDAADAIAPLTDRTDAAWVDRAEAEIMAALATDERPATAAATLPDDQRLRDLIREILREELHGNLGERITTNVRKLVRAEINRLITLHDAQ